MRLYIRNKYKKIYSNLLKKELNPSEEWELVQDPNLKPNIKTYVNKYNPRYFKKINAYENYFSVYAETYDRVEIEYTTYSNYETRYHREDGPARMVFRNGEIQWEQYYINNSRHREDGPADIFYNRDGSKDEIWYNHDRKHREDGPAVIHYSPSGQIVKTEYYIDGLRVYQES
jgi:hypothetical protein